GGGVGLLGAGWAAWAPARGLGGLMGAGAVRGAGGGVRLPLGLALLGAGFPPQQRPKALGIFGAVTGLGVVLGPLVGGAVVQGLSWAWIFWVNVPVGLAAIALTRGRVGGSAGPGSALGLLGLVPVAGRAAGLVWALGRGEAGGGGGREGAGSRAAGAARRVGFIPWERRARQPMLPLGLFRSRAFASGNAAMFLLWGSALGLVFFLAQFLQIGLH